MMLHFNIFWHSFVDRDNDDSGVNRYELTPQEESVNESVLGVVCISTKIFCLISLTTGAQTSAIICRGRICHERK